MRYLFIAEKPSLMQAVQACYRNNAAIIKQKVGEIDFIALAGHVCGSFTPNDYDEWAEKKWDEIQYPIVPTVWKVKVKEDKKDIVEKIKAKVKSYDGIIVGTDSDIEGYGIYWMLEEFLGLRNKKALRYIEHSLTETEILQDLLNMTDHHQDPVHAAATLAYLVRMRADWLFGYNSTRVMSTKKGVKLRIGRVKAVVNNIVYQNSMAIDNFKPEKYYQVRADYGTWGANLLTPEGAVAQYKDKKDIQTYPLDGVVKSKKTERKYESAPQLFDLTAIQAEAGRSFKYTPARTLEIVQSLYEKHKVISYPRTQCRFVTTEKAKEFKMMLGHMSAFPDLAEIAKRVTDEDIQRAMTDKHVVNDKEVQKESHDALLPTSKKADPSVMTEDEKNVCHMIYARLLCQFLPKAADDRTDIVITHGSGDFGVSGKVVVEQGWRVLFKEAKDVVLPNLKEGDSVKARTIGPVEKTTTPPKRLTQYTLINAMQNIANVIEDKEMRKSLAESKGIGTPATRAAIIKELIDSGYMEDRKGGLYITHLGKAYIEALDGIDIVSPVFAARLDMQMKKVQHREIGYDEAYTYVRSELNRLCEKMNAIEATAYVAPDMDVKCPFCGSPFKAQKYTYACTSEACGMKVNRIIAGKEIDEKILTTLLTKRSTAMYTFKGKDKKTFRARLLLEDNKSISFDFSSGVICPKCKEKDVTLNKGGAFCECGFKLFRKLSGHEFTDRELKELIKKGKVSGITDFVSKAGKPFTADVVLENGAAKFQFPKKS